MKVIHITSKILLKLVEIGVIVVLIMSLIPILSGGIAVDVDETPSAIPDPDNGANVIISGEFTVTSTLLWDVNDFTYSVSVGDKDRSVAESEPFKETIAKNDKTKLTFHLEVPLMSLALYMVDSGLTEDGDIGDMNVPIIFHVSGAYVQDMVRFSMDLDISIPLEVDGTYHPTYDTDTNTLDIEVTFIQEMGLGIPPMSGTISLTGMITGNDNGAGSFSIEKVGDEYTIKFSLGTGDINKELLDAVRASNITIEVDGEEYTLGALEKAVVEELLSDIISGVV